VDIGEPRLRGTAALQACTETDGPLLADSLEGVRSVGAVKECQSRAGQAARHRSSRVDRSLWTTAERGTQPVDAPGLPTGISTIHNEIASGEIAARIGSQKYYYGSDFPRFAYATHGRKV
jgi:hypothetical protein